jgi:hypothetical protein
VIDPIGTRTLDDNPTDPVYGAGLQYRINDPFAVRGEYVRSAVEDLDVDTAKSRRSSTSKAPYAGYLAGLPVARRFTSERGRPAIALAALFRPLSCRRRPADR